MNEKIILIADHETDVLEIYTDFLGKRGFNVGNIITANDGAKALGMLTEINVDVAVLDIALPKVSGIEIVKEAEFRQLKTQFIFLTGFGAGDDLFEQAMRGYNVRYIVEKVSIVMSDFLDKLKRLI